eukprot:CAMPEP_0118951210 /NCGR_PEP_ID=MMETSP1169-20130426/52720_1 /TAXON_ID=36882 /ORGANISM="Pyramimonas obovata, Strain CCMP722" /LENGTH=138 /DNA_ID=CAMNT_0006898223 /DNA_START=275 /DNA_END=688 /DNA_ORIENTATION=-
MSTALALQAEGHTVTLFDSQKPGEGASEGTNGLFADYAVEPLAMPDFARATSLGMLQKDPPVHVRFAQLATFLPWLRQLQATCTPGHVEQIADTRRTLMAHAAPAMEALLKVAKAEGMLVQNGHIQVFSSEAAARAYE